MLLPGAIFLEFDRGAKGASSVLQLTTHLRGTIVKDDVEGKNKRFEIWLKGEVGFCKYEMHPEWMLKYKFTKNI